jgi:hypothetical protein
MLRKSHTPDQAKTLVESLHGKSPHTVALFEHFVKEFKKVGKITVHPTKTMIGIANEHKRIAYIVQLGKNFIDVTFPFKQAYPDNLCFHKIAQVPGQQQFNHHFRMMALEDVNKEVRNFMKLAYEQGS